MGPFSSLDLSVVLEWEEHKSLSYFMGAEVSHKSLYESIWRIHENWCFWEHTSLAPSPD